MIFRLFKCVVLLEGFELLLTLFLLPDELIALFFNSLDVSLLLAYFFIFLGDVFVQVALLGSEIVNLVLVRVGKFFRSLKLGVLVKDFLLQFLFRGFKTSLLPLLAEVLLLFGVETLHELLVHLPLPRQVLVELVGAVLSLLLLLADRQELVFFLADLIGQAFLLLHQDLDSVILGEVQA